MHIIGEAIAPMLSPLGFGTWQAGATLIPGFLAKEVIISSMAILYSSNENGLVNVIQHQFTSLSAYAFMIFILLYVPCISTVATIKRNMFMEMDTHCIILPNSYSISFNIGILSNK